MTTVFKLLLAADVLVVLCLTLGDFVKTARRARLGHRAGSREGGRP